MSQQLRSEKEPWNLTIQHEIRNAVWNIKVVVRSLKGQNQTQLTKEELAMILETSCLRLETLLKE